MLSRLVSWMADQGSRGVDLFFVLSGFLITGILLSNLGLPAGRYFLNFYVRRSLRIFPLYFGVLFVAFVVLPMLGIRYTTLGMADAQANQAWLWLYGSNFGMAQYGLGFGRFSHFWTLAIEEHFYLVWPAIVWFCGASKLPLACLSVVAGSILCRIFFVAFGDSSSAHLLTPCRADALALGGLLAWTVHPLSSGSLKSIRMRRIAQWLFGVCLTISILCLTMAGEFVFANSVLLPSVISVLSVSFIVLVLPSQQLGTVSMASKLIDNLLLRKFGKYSYAIYVFHVPLIPVIYVLLAKLGTLIRLPVESLSFVILTLSYFLITASVCFLISVISWEVYEKHFLNLKRFFF